MVVLVPTIRPVIFPDPSIEALLLLLLHVPPELASLNDTVVPKHSELEPWIGNGLGLTVTTLETVQLAPAV